MDEQTARRLHQDSLVIDAHNDSIVALIRRGMSLDGTRRIDFHQREGAVAYLRQYQSPDDGVQLDLPKAREGGLDAAFFAVDCTRPWGNHLLYCMDALGCFLQEVEEHSGSIAVARCAADIERTRAEGRLAAILAVENSDALEKSLHVLPLLYQLGVRAMTFTHSTRSWAGDGCEVEGGGGLTDFGRQLLAQMNELGMVVDVSHLNEPGFWDVARAAQAPFMATHSCCRALCDHPRNLRDEQLRALAEKGGVVSITFVPDFIDAHNPTFDGLLDHIEHAVAVAGIDHVGLGSDFDGGGLLLADATCLPDVAVGLAARGYAEADVRKILGANQLRLLQQVIG